MVSVSPSKIFMGFLKGMSLPFIEAGNLLPARQIVVDLSNVYVPPKRVISKTASFRSLPRIIFAIFMDALSAAPVGDIPI